MDKMAMKMSVEDWNTVIAVNLSGSFYMAQPVLEHMVERGTGRIIFVSSVIGEMGAIGQANYAAYKAGMLGLTKTLARETAFILARAGRLEENGVGITVNTVTPGYVATEMLENVPEKVLDKIKSKIPVGRLCHQMRSPTWFTSWPQTPGPTSLARYGASTAAWTCNSPGQYRPRNYLLQ
jgi:NAD(P)-dependent dehydrogenase (short-subunit alcohol dehydrogenase family)